MRTVTSYNDEKKHTMHSSKDHDFNSGVRAPD